MSYFAQCSSLNDLSAATSAAARAMGFSHFMYGSRLHSGLGASQGVFIEDCPDGMMQQWSQQKLLGEGFHSSKLRGQSLPVEWSPINDDNFASSSEQASRLAITVPLYGTGSEFGTMTVVREKAEQDDIDEIASNAMLLAAATHDMARRLVKERSTGKQFTEREVQCIWHLIDGKSSKEIAQELNLSVASINFHITNIYGKIGAKNQRHAVCRLAQLGYRQRIRQAAA